MKFEIENGITIVKTGDPGGLKNKTGHTGICYIPHLNKYRAEITFQKRRYQIGYSRDLDYLAAKQEEAERQIAAGTFPEWIKEQYALRKEQRRKNARNKKAEI